MRRRRRTSSTVFITSAGREIRQFEPECFDLIHSLTTGIPRRINTLCNRLMLGAYLAERHKLGAADVQAIAREINEELGADATLALAPVAEEESPEAAPSPVVSAEALNWHRHFENIEQRIDRLDKTVGAAVDLLHGMLHPGQGEQAEHAGGALMGEMLPPRGPMVCVVGARPNYMKMAPLIRAFCARRDLPGVVLVHTGQHYDVEMNERLFADLELPSPDLNLEVGSGTHAVQTAEIMRRFEPVHRRAGAELRHRRR